MNRSAQWNMMWKNAKFFSCTVSVIESLLKRCKILLMVGFPSIKKKRNAQLNWRNLLTREALASQ